MNLKLEENAFIPIRATFGSAGYDLKSIEDVEIDSSTRKLIKTGVYLEIPYGYYGQLKSRSGLAIKFSLDVAAGVIDSDYRGEIKVILCNNGKEKYKVSKGDSIAQLIISRHELLDMNHVKKLNETERGDKGFGSTDKVL